MKRTTAQFREDYNKVLEATDLLSYEERRNALEQAKADWYHEMEPGDRCHVQHWTDRTPCTIVKKTATTLTIRHDAARKTEKHNPEFIPGGFGAHCVNNNCQSDWWECYEDPNGATEVFRWSKVKNVYVNTSGESLFPEWENFYDYNF